MSKTITELWYGNVAPYYQADSDNREIQQKKDAFLQCLQIFSNQLDEKTKKVFRKVQNRQQEYWQASREQAFCQGFALGMRLAAEALLTAETTVEDMAQTP